MECWSGFLKELQHERMGAILERVVYASNQRPLHGAVFPTARLHGAEAGVAPFTIIPNDTLGDFMPLIPLTLGSVGLEVLVPKGGVVLPRGTQSFYWTLGYGCWQCTLKSLYPDISILAGVLDPAQQEEDMWNPDEPFGNFLVLLSHCSCGWTHAAVVSLRTVWWLGPLRS